ncbi:MAG: hypothetical protein ACRC28_14215 [Clostridium sp.]|uniref:hypothetical protein n=1 Tax=Clostridium sp. TaxID=1506 RepID=UPI003F34E536
MFKRKIVLIKENEVILGREKTTYEKLCKVIKEKERVVFVILNKNIIIKKVKTKNIEVVHKFIEDELLKYNSQYLIHFEKIRGENSFIVYAIKTNELIEKITERFVNLKVLPIEIFIKEILKEEGSYKIGFMDRKYNIRVDNNIVYTDINEENFKEGKLVITRERGKII